MEGSPVNDRYLQEDALTLCPFCGYTLASDYHRIACKRTGTKDEPLSVWGKVGAGAAITLSLMIALLVGAGLIWLFIRLVEAF